MNILEKVYFEFLFHNMTIQEFEKEIYENQEIEKLINNEDYIELISLDFSSKYIFNEIEHILDKYIEFSKYYKNKLITMIDIALNQSEGTALVLMEFYDMYCHGCEFLQTLGLDYGLTCVVPPTANEWFDLSEQEQDSLVKSFYPKIIVHLAEVRQWIENDKILITRYDERNMKYICTDKR